MAYYDECDFALAALEAEMKEEDDMHCRNVAKVLGIKPEEVTKEQRALAKRVCFGAMGEEEAYDQLKVYLRLAELGGYGAATKMFDKDKKR